MQKQLKVGVIPASKITALDVEELLKEENVVDAEFNSDKDEWIVKYVGDLNLIR